MRQLAGENQQLLFLDLENAVMRRFWLLVAGTTQRYVCFFGATLHTLSYTLYLY